MSADRIWSGCDACPRIVCAELTASSPYEANGIGDTHQCGHCLGWDADSIRAAIADAVEVVGHPAEMGPHYCPAGCAANGADDHEDYCEAFCRTHRCELDPEAGCGYCVLDDTADELGIGRRSRAHLWATGMVR